QNSDIVTVNVGGKLFQTTVQTLSLAGSHSILSTISGSNDPFFIDRDPEIFSILLSLLRTGNLASRAKQLFDVQDLIFESRFYGIENLLIDSLANPSQFDAFNLKNSMILPLNGRDSPTAMCCTTRYGGGGGGGLHVSHGSKITSFDWSLSRKSTILTEFIAIDSLFALSPAAAAAGAVDFPGLQILDLEKGFIRDTLHWENVTKTGSTVQAIGASPDHLFTSFESSRRNSNCIMVYDLNNNLNPVSMIGHYEIYGADLISGLPSTKLEWISSRNLLMASGSHSSHSGVSGRIQFWDIRSSNVVLEIKEKEDCFADVTASDVLSAMFKVGVNSGDVYFSDLRRLDVDESWVRLGEGKKAAAANGKKEGAQCRIRSHGNHAFCSRDSNVEVWSEVMMSSSRKDEPENSSTKRIFRKNTAARDEGSRNRVSNFIFGGGKMFMTRKDEQCVEVW
ncbi:hypothetical protein M569_08570, partial [Genlisea aurea]